MNTKRRQYLILLVVMGFMIMAGGCGGGGGSNSGGGGGGTLPTDPVISFESLNGTWVARNGSGTSSGYGYNFQLRMIEGAGILSVVSTQNSEAVVQVSHSFTWDVYSGQTRVDTVYLGSDNERVIVTKSGEAFSYTFLSGNRVDITIVSDTTLSVEESGIYTYPNGEQYSYRASYYMDKQ